MIHPAATGRPAPSQFQRATAEPGGPDAPAEMDMDNDRDPCAWTAEHAIAGRVAEAERLARRQAQLEAG